MKIVGQVLDIFYAIEVLNCEVESAIPRQIYWCIELFWCG